MAPSILGLASAILGIPTITTFIQNLISALTRNSEYIENVQCTRNQLQEFEDEDLLGKMSILLTPTAYSDGSLNTVIPPYQVLPTELVTNGTFDTDLSGWTDTNNHWQWTNQGAYFSLTSTHNPLSQTLTNPVGVKLKFTFSLNIIQGTVNVYYKDTGNSSVQSQYTQSGTYTIETVAVKQNTDINFSRYAGVNTEFYLDNVSVKEIQEADFDFSRGSSATRVNEQGLVEDVQILSGELVQNGNFEQIGSELVTNGDFSDNSWWGLDPVWSISNGSANCNGSGVIYKGGVLTVGKTYKVQVEVSSYISGTLTYPNASYTLPSAVGSYTFYYKANSQTVSFTGTSFIGSIDNVSVKEVGQNWTFGTGWSMGDGKAIALNTLSSISQSFSTTASSVYKVTFTVLDYVSGDIKVQFTGGTTVNSDWYNDNGTFIVYLTALSGNNSLAFKGRNGAEFTGSIDNVSVVEVTNDTDLPRIDYSPYSGAGTCGHLLLEPQRTNLLLNSTNFSGSNWFNFRSATTLNQYNSLTNLNNATLFYPTESSTYASLFDTTNTTNGIFTRSVFAKANGKDFLCIDDTVGGQNWFNLSNGTLGTINSNYDAEIISYGGGWYRCSVTNKSAATYNYLVVYIVTDADNSTTITANGTNGILLFGGQTEEGSYATSYIPTSGSTVTRSADVANNSGNADLFNDSEGVLYAEVERFDNDTAFGSIGISDGTTNNQVVFKFRNTTNLVWGLIKSGGANQAIMQYTASDLTTFNKLAIKYKENDFSLWFNGVQVVTDTSGIVATGLKTLRFQDGGAFEEFRGKTKALAVFKEALSNDELELLTGEGYNSFAALAAASNYNVI